MEVQGSFCMGDKVKWILALLFLVLVLIGIRKVESIVTQGEVKTGQASPLMILHIMPYLSLESF